jgi:hypothetical protein
MKVLVNFFTNTNIGKDGTTLRPINFFKEFIAAYLESIQSSLLARFGSASDSASIHQAATALQQLSTTSKKTVKKGSKQSKHTKAQATAAQTQQQQVKPAPAHGSARPVQPVATALKRQSNPVVQSRATFQHQSQPHRQSKPVAHTRAAAQQPVKPAARQSMTVVSTRVAPQHQPHKAQRHTPAVRSRGRFLELESESDSVSDSTFLPLVRAFANHHHMHAPKSSPKSTADSQAAMLGRFGRVGDAVEKKIDNADVRICFMNCSQSDFSCS